MNNINTINEKLKNIPSVSIVLEDEKIKVFCKDHGKDFITSLIRELLEEKRQKIINEEDISPLLEKSISDQIADKISKIELKKLTPSINATGTILHTNLGRAPLSDVSIEAIKKNAQYTNLEINRITGKRGKREDHAVELIKRITKCEYAVIVNNNAAATFLSILSLCKNKDIIIARGQLVEIGESFRIHEIIEQTGAKLIEVGSTNKVHLKDYENAITENTAAIIHVHTSNYSIEGFSSSVPIKKIAELCKEKNIISINDLGSGSLYPLEKFGIKNEPLVQNSIKNGADITLFSTDKLIGGPQGGIIIGKKNILMKIRKHPLYRTFRTGKLTLAALCSVLELYLNFEKNFNKIPFYYYLTKSIKKIKKNINRCSKKLKKTSFDLEIKKEMTQIGSGTSPVKGIETLCLSLSHPLISAEKLSFKMRTAEIPVYGRIIKDRFILDFRTISEAQSFLIADMLIEIENKI